MAYVKNTWVDQKVERPRTYQRNENIDGSVTLIDDFGKVTEIGTPVNADNMNHIEDGLVGVAIRLHNMAEVFAKDEWVKSGDKLYKSKQDQNKGHAVTESEWYSEVSLGGASMPVGTIFAHSASDKFVPENSLPCDGAEYTKEQFPSLYTDWLNSKEYFDRSKVTVVGTPTITDDGIASINAGNSLKFISLFNKLNSSSIITIKGKWHINNYSNTSNYTFFEIGGGAAISVYSNNKGYLTMLTRGNDGKFQYAKEFIPILDEDIEINFIYNLKTEEIKADFIQQGQIIGTSNISNTMFNTSGSNCVVATFSSETKVWATIDLKQFSISVDGKEVYSPTTGKLETCSYEQYQQEITATGECLKFGIDTAKGKFKVPTKLNKYVSPNGGGEAPVKGNGMAVGWTDKTHLGSLYWSSQQNTNIATDIYGKPIGTNMSRNGGFNNNQAIGITSDSTKSGIVADLTNAIKTKEIRYFIVVATGSIKQSEMDWSQWASGLEGKANTDLGNTTTKLADNFIEKLIPDYSAGISISKVPYTAPVNGIVSISPRGNNGTVTINGVSVSKGSDTTAVSNAIILVSKGDVVSTLTNTLGGGFSTFFPLKGAK